MSKVIIHHPNHNLLPVRGVSLFGRIQRNMMRHSERSYRVIGAMNMYQRGASVRDIASAYGVSETTVRKYLRDYDSVISEVKFNYYFCLFSIAAVAILVAWLLGGFLYLTLLLLISVLIVAKVEIVNPWLIQKQRAKEELQKQKIQAEKKQKADPYKRAGVKLFKEGKFSDSIEMLGNAVHINSADAESLKYLGLAHLSLHSYERALRSLRLSRSMNLEDEEVNQAILRITDHLEFRASVIDFYRKKR